MVESQQSWNAEEYARHAHFVPEFGKALVRLLDPRPGERVLDLGCGDGVLTMEIAARGAHVLGVDRSPELVEAARARGLEVRLIDARHLEFHSEFDAAFSNAVLHWILEPDEVIAGVKRALKPGGRFVAEFGGHGNVAAITVALLSVLRESGIDAWEDLPWYYPTAEEYRERLERQGFRVHFIDLIPRPTALPTGIEGWLDTFAKPFLTRLPEEFRAQAKSRVVTLLHPVLCDRHGNWTADYVRLRFFAEARG